MNPLKLKRKKAKTAAAARPCKHHPDREVFARGLCRSCYDRQRVGREPTAPLSQVEPQAFQRLEAALRAWPATDHASP